MSSWTFTWSGCRVFSVRRGLVDPVAADLGRGHEAGFEVEPFFPAIADEGLVDVVFGELDKEVVVSGFAFHEAAVEVAEVGVFEAFAEAFEAFAAAGFDEGEDEELVEEALVRVAAFLLEFEEAVDVDIFSLRPQVEAAFVELRQYKAEVAPFFCYDGG
jgi:hypothetical protein